MLEAAIVICLGALIFILFRKAPKSERVFKKRFKKSRIDLPSFNKIFSKRRHVDESEIINAIVADQKTVITPKDIEMAQDSYSADDPELAKVLFEVNELININDYYSAEEKAISAISMDKHCDQAYAFIALISLKKGEHENAKIGAETALKCNKENAMAYAVIGEYFLIKEKYNEAIDNLLKAVMIDRNNASWYGLLGQAYLEIRQYAKSAKSFKRASSLDLDNREYRRLATIAEEKQMSHAKVFRGK